MRLVHAAVLRNAKEIAVSHASIVFALAGDYESWVVDPSMLLVQSTKHCKQPYSN
jgi:hypothetical protein